jgi:BirA family biotin operon repressor/biotin-[acetyl-CoA-carboxylase] ligase
VLRPDCAAAEAAQLGFVAAVALCDALGSVLPPLVEVTLKWPNDVLVNERKAAGILLESVMDADGGLDALLLGMGVNIAHYPEESAFPATSLKFEGARRDLDEVELLEAFARHFLTWVNHWVDDGFAPIRHAWLNRSKNKGREIEARLPDRTLQGVFEDLDETGALQLRMSDGSLRSITVGEIFWRP